MFPFPLADGNVRVPERSLKKPAWSSISSPAGYSDSLAVISAGISSIDKPGAYPAHKLSDVRLHAPLANPPRIFAIGLNYRDHAIESKMALPTVPVVFFKMPTAIIGPGEHIVLPKNSTEPDYEAELAFVIGKGGYRIPASAWRDHVYGYTIVNDVSARDVQRATSQWSLGKELSHLLPHGPGHRARRRDRRPARTRHQPHHQRRSPAELEHPRTDLQGSRPGREPIS